MKNTHINEFLVKAIDEDGCELFIASLEEGGYRFGWTGGVLINVPKGHYVSEDILYTHHIERADSEWLEIKFEEWLSYIEQKCCMIREYRKEQNS